MNVLFLTLSRITDIGKRGIYTDLIRKFSDDGHQVYVVSPFERRFNESTRIISFPNVQLLKVKTLNIQKTNVVEKGIGTLLLEYQFLAAIRKHFSDVKFGLVLYSTPPITLTKVISWVKRRDNAQTYLLLKDIFPQNAVDLGLIRKNGILHRMFRRKEKLLYRLSDHIGCMSPANVSYLLKHNTWIDPHTVEVNPNSIEPMERPEITPEERKQVREAFNIPDGRTVFIYGGNLGKPQGIRFLTDTLESNLDNPKAFFVVIGSGTEYPRIREWYRTRNPKNVLVLDYLPKEEYDNLVKACDVGMIFLDPRFTIPNFPSRLLSYIEIRKPVLAATDTNTDVGTIAEANGFGFWCKSGDLEQMNANLRRYVDNPEIIRDMGMRGYRFFLDNFTTAHSYNQIKKHLKN